jgi:hypothetical protein
VKLSEGDIEIDFQGMLQAEKFDDAKHGMSHCLKAVDFLCDWANDLWLVELKDPEEAAIPPLHKAHVWLSLRTNYPRKHIFGACWPKNSKTRFYICIWIAVCPTSL